MKYLLIAITVVCVLVIAFYMGPKKEYPSIEDTSIDLLEISLDSVDGYVKNKDLDIPNLKPGNASRILWADSIRKTRYSMVYLHGFSASPMESHPTHIRLARHYGFNLYLPLLHGHGQDDVESFKDLEPNDLIESAKEAIAIGQLLGEDVIVISCSTGSTLSIYLASGNKELIDIMVMYSPNIALNDPTSSLITGPWGQQIVNSVVGPYWRPGAVEPDSVMKYWTVTYRSEGIMALQALLESTMTEEVLQQINQPYFAGFYYKNEEERDKVISVEAIRKFHDLSATPVEWKKLKAFPNAGEHVITNPLKANEVDEVYKETVEYLDSILELTDHDRKKTPF